MCASSTASLGLITDARGRVGVITERRDGGVFARPADLPEATSYLSGWLNSATFWSRSSDGSLRGLWVDSPLGSFVSAEEGK